MGRETQHFRHTHITSRANKIKGCQNLEDTVSLVYLVDEEMDIYIGVLVLARHLASWAQPS
jgi:hypothetical protein